MFSKVEYTVAPVQKEAVWDGVIQEDAMWCYPEESSFKQQMRSVKEKYSTSLSRAKKLKKYLTENFTEEIMYDNFVEAMDVNTGDKAPENDDSQKIVML